MKTWQDLQYGEELAVGIAAVKEAGRLCRTVQNAIDPGTLQKQDRSPVTVADFGSQALICRAIDNALPDDPVIGEEDAGALRETANTELAERVVGEVQRVRPEAEPQAVLDWIDRGGADRYSERFWTLDPIDGTKGFLRGGHYAICLALLVEGRPTAAVVGCPNLHDELTRESGDGTLLVALRGQGAWQQPLFADGDARPIRVSSETDPARIRFCESVEAAHSSHGDAARIAERLGLSAEPVRLDSQTKYGVVARGEAEAYLRLPRDDVYREKIWDHAGGALVVTEAGGRVTDIRGRDLDFAQGRKLDKNLGVIVSNGPVHDTLLETIDALGIGRF